MNDPLPLPVPPLGYVSVAPYIVTLEYAEAVRTVIVQGPLKDAMALNFHPSCPFGEACSPFRRVVIDARGVTVFGFVEDPDAEISSVITSEVADLLRSFGMNPFDVVTLELEMVLRQ